MFARFAIGLLGILWALKGSTAENTTLPQFYRTVIDELIQTKPTNVVSSYLYDPRSNITFDIMVESQIYLYWRYAARNNEDPLYLRNLAYFIENIQSDFRYYNYTAAAKQRLNDVFVDLPSSLQYFFSRVFRLVNNHNGETLRYLYTASESDGKSYYFVFGEYEETASAWWDKEVDAPIQADSGYLNMKVDLRKDNMSIFRKQDVNLKNVILLWIYGGRPTERWWSVDLVDNKYLVFSQDGYLLCASPKMYSSKLRYTYGYDTGYTRNSPECQWIAKAY